MTEFSASYKNGIDCLYIPDYTIEELESVRYHKKFIRKQKSKVLISVIFFIITFSVVVSTTAYAAYKVHKSMKFTAQGIKIDISEVDSTQDSYIQMHDYSFTVDSTNKTEYNTAPVYQQEIKYFDSWSELLKVIDFPVVYPENLQYSELEIAYNTDRSHRNIEASYTMDDRALVIRYSCFPDQNWDFAVDYNTQITDQYVYTNKYHYDFWIVECQSDKDIQTNVTACVNNYLIQLFFSGYECDDIFEIIEEFNLSVY